MSSDVGDTAQQIAEQFAAHPNVSTVALAGSRTATTPDALSDIDLYVYADPPLSMAERATIARACADEMQLDNHFWEDGDEWFQRESGIPIDVTYRSPRDIEGQLERVIVQHQASLGYSTCFWFNVQNSVTLFDQQGWYARLQATAAQPYPDALQRAIIAKNHPVLRTLLHSAYIYQLAAAVARRDLVSIQHRSAALLASYFDILFAVNKALMPGEKRLITYAGQLSQTPVNMAEDVEQFILAVSMPDTIIDAANRLIDRLDELLKNAGLDDW